MGPWAWFHFVMAGIALVYALTDPRKDHGRQHVRGGWILVGSTLASCAVRAVLGEAIPIMAYWAIDVIALVLFATIMFRKKAVWAAVCVMLHKTLLTLHLAYFASGQMSGAAYAWTQGGLFFLSVVALILGTAAGRHEWGAGLDRRLFAHFRGWSWSGTFRVGAEAHIV